MSCSLQQLTGLERPRRVSVNGVAIAREDIARETQNHPADKPLAAWQAAARALVVRELLLQEAQRLQIVAEPLADAEGRRETEPEAQIRQLIAGQVQTPQADEDACRRYYQSNRKRFRSPDLFEARHILLAAAPNDAKGRAEGREQAKQIIDELKRDPSRFAALAEALSACPSSKVGGSLGQIGPGQTVPEFERALSAIASGEVAADPVETRYGIHVVVVDRRIEGRELPFEQVRERIAEWLTEKVRRTAIAQYLSILAGRAAIEGVEIAASPSPLVQ
jgi:peptidyl-prolyl cis-trans isomerase C